MWLKKKTSRANASEDKEITDTNYVDLLPNESADTDGTYAHALNYALDNPRIRNIAITGPYGSGKSSIIASFIKRNERNYTFLNISLASFKETDSSESDSDADRQIERSILQQMLYGVESSRLPYSRFKRILVPRYAHLKSAFLLVWIAIVIFIYFNPSLFYSLNLLTESPTFTSIVIFITISFLFAIPTVLLADIYRASVGFSLKKISLKNAEIEGGEHSEVSILNRHIDEIIYFFDEIKCDVVVIEDLDRFGSPEIFVKLREVNKLINDGRHERPPIKFLYALKDDMFAHRNRAKFFDFIIPIIPVISSANSLEKIHDRIRGTSYENRLDDTFLCEVSVYLDDLRCIHNIFNEYNIYYAQLPSDTLDATKLLAMIIYKNVYPDDFEALHHGKGMLFGACALRIKTIENKKAKYTERTTQIKKLLKAAEDEHLENVDELIQVYCSRIARKSGQHVISIWIGQNSFQLSQPIPFESFQHILDEKNIRVQVGHPSFHQGRPINLDVSFADIEEEINPGVKFLERKNQIDAKDQANRAKLRSELRTLEQRIVGLPHIKMCELLRDDDVDESWISSDSANVNMRLLRYLVNNGYIDDTYYLYTANFYEGRLTSNDHAFIVSIRDFRVPPPEQRIDTPKEVCRRMRQTDFYQQYVLNISLIDYLVDPTTNMPAEIDAAVSVIRGDFSAAEPFLSAYYSSGQNIKCFVEAVAKRWPGFGAASLDCNLAAESLCNILKFVDHNNVANEMNEDGVLTDYLSHYGDSVFAANLVPPKQYDALIGLRVRFSDVESLDENGECVEFVKQHGLYEINAKNILYLMRRGHVQSDCEIEFQEERNLTCIFSAEDSSIADYIRSNIGEYVSNVLLTLPKNTRESEDTIVYLLESDCLDDAQKKDVLRKEEHIFDDLQKISKRAWHLLFEESKVLPNWKNIGLYYDNNKDRESILVAFLEREGVANTLGTKSMEESGLPEENVQELARFILDCETLGDKVYEKLIKCIPYWYESFSGIPSSRFSIVATNQTVRLTEASFKEAEGNDAVQALLIAKNFKSFADERDKYSVSDKVRILILSHNISTQEKIDICAGLSVTSLTNDVELATTVCTLLTASSCDISSIGNDIAVATISNTSNTDDALRLLTLFIPKFEEATIMDILEKMPEPFCEIASYGRRPKLERNKINIKLAEALEMKRAISSMKDEDALLRINTWKSADHATASDS